jgi:hypothetical protein
MVVPQVEEAERVQARTPFDHGRPELIFDARGPDLPRIKDAIASAGCFVIRNLFDLAGILHVRARAVIATQAWEFMVARGYAKGHESFIEGAYRAGHIPSQDIDPPQTFSDIGTDNYDRLASDLFGSTSRDFALRRTMFGDRVNYLGFHQDGFFATPGYNFWTPLNDAGVTSPGLEVIIGSGGLILAHEVIATAAPQIIIDHYGENCLWHPEVRASDALVFTTFMMHRTYVTPEMSDPRYSLELRGSIKTPMPIAGVAPEHWTAPMARSFAEMKQRRAI